MSSPHDGRLRAAAFHAVVKVLVVFALPMLLLFAMPGKALAAVTDCVGTSLDGQARCIPPTYAPETYSTCDIAGSYLYRSNAWNACYSELGLANPIRSESSAIALANCFDKKIGGAAGGITGPIPWLPAGASYNDNLCYIGVVREVEGHHVTGFASLSGRSGGIAFQRWETPSCPGGYSGVYQNIRGTNELVRCKPAPPCSAYDKVPSPSRAGVCLSVKEVVPCPKCQPGVGDPIYPLTGVNKQTVPTGFRIGNTELVLTYTTARALHGVPLRVLPAFGRLWSSNLHKNLGIATNATVVTAYRGDAAVVAFSLANGSYVAEANINDRLVAVAGGYLYTDASAGQVESYNAQGQLTRIDAATGSSLTFTYSAGVSALAPAAGYLTRVTDNNGRTLNFRYALPQGASEVLTATTGLIARITDTAGQGIAVAYDASQNLSTLTWPDASSTQFLYEDPASAWAMTGRIDATGARDATWTYDAQGLALTVSRAAGQDAFSLSYATSPRYIVSETEDTALNILYRRYQVVPPAGLAVTGPGGQVSTWNAASASGTAVLAGITQPAGSGTAAASSARTYDAASNLLSSDDPDGTRTCYAYDGSNRETVRIEGLTTASSCAAVTSAGAPLPAGARKITTAWHPDWRLPTRVVQGSKLTTTVYHGQPDPFAANAIANCTGASLMPNGKPLAVVCKQVDQTILADGSVDPTVAGRVSGFMYDSYGRLLTMTDPESRSVTNAYHATPGFSGSPYDPDFGKVVLLMHADGADGSASFVDSSSRASSISVGGNANLTTAQSKFGGASASFDGTGDYLSISPSALDFGTGDFTIEGWFYLSSAGSEYRFLYHQHWGSAYMSIRFGNSGFGARLQFGIDDTTLPGVYSSALTQSSLLNGWHHVALTRGGGVVRAFLDGTLLTLRNNNYTGPSVTSWSDASNIVGTTDGNVSTAGAAAWLGYLDEFRITKGVARYTADFIAPATKFADSASTVEPQGHSAGDLQTVTNAAGQVVQYTSYDPAGRVRQMVDPKGVTTDLAYTPRGWISTATETPPGGSPRTTTYTYDVAGQLTQVANVDGTTLRYGYDAAHRLNSITDTDGNSITYTLDTSGNRVADELRDPGGQLRRTISRSFDALNRLQQVTGAAQ